VGLDKQKSSILYKEEESSTVLTNALGELPTQTVLPARENNGKEKAARHP
jgi:hypothetical protein